MADASLEKDGTENIEAQKDEPSTPGFTAHDREDMKRMGKTQELMRNFRLISLIAFTSCVMGIWEFMLTANTPGLIAGGLAGLFWSLLWAYTGQLFIVLSLAEMASLAPTAGGQYHRVSEFAPRRFQRILSYTSGWLPSFSWQSFVCVDSFIVGGVIQAIIVLHNPNYVPERWQATLLTMASVIFFGLFNIFAAKQLPAAEAMFCAFHVLTFFSIIGVLWGKAPRQTAKAVFAQFSDNGAGWPNLGWTVLVGQVSTIFVVVGSDSVAHIS